MRIIHFGHSCVLLETGGARLLFDPGVFSTGFETARELDAVLITHQHADHIDGERLRTVLAENPRAVLVVDPGTEKTVAELGLTAQIAQPGGVFQLGGAVVNAVGGEHAVIHPDVPIVPNAGYVVDHGAFYHPGDALFVPQQAIDVLGVPTAAPWMKAADAVEFLRAVSPRVGVPIHQAILVEGALPIYYGMLERLAPKGTTVTAPPAGELTEV